MNILSLKKSFYIGFVSIAAIPFFSFSILANANTAKATDPAKVTQCTSQNISDNQACASKPSENEKDQCLKAATEKFRVCTEKP